MPRPRKLTPEILQAALIGLDAQRQRIDGQISEIRRLLGSNSRSAAPAATPEAPSRRKRTMSAAARARIGAAQRKRWAESKAASAPAAPKKVWKRKLSAAGRKAIAEAAKRRWAALREAKKASK
jgi:hypothetical protein